MISKKMEEALNEQLNKELFSSYLYLSMAAYFEEKSLIGFANWMKVQAQEEKFHADKIFDYINERGGRVLLKQIDAPKTDWDTLVSVFEETLEHEQFITRSINEINKLAKEEDDYATSNFLQWYISEQVEEEASVNELLDQLKFYGEDKHALLLLEREMRSRVFTAPAE